MYQASPPLVAVKSLRQQVYDFLRDEMNSGRILPGSFLNLNEMSHHLGISKTPLRDALLHLEVEGFVTIFPRRGIMVNALSLEKIRNLYEIIGALEAQVVASLCDRFDKGDVDRMDALNEAMRRALEQDDFNLYYEKNLEFHDTYLRHSANEDLLKTVQTMKERLYDFPRKKGFVKEWEVRSTGEHADIIARLRRGDYASAADYIRDVHWSFQVQERYIRRYYFLQNGEGEGQEEQR
jgi:DNA-binding GntR family transcriptional regulator